MAIGLIGSVGKATEKKQYDDIDVSINAQTQGVDNWQPYSTAGTNCYVYDLPIADIPGATDMTASTDFALIPRGTITESLLSNFSNINAVEIAEINSVLTMRFYSMNGKVTVDIPVTIRRYYE